MTLATKNFQPDAPHFFYSIGNTEVLVLGTAHVSRKSVEDVEQAFDNFQPDAVCVELCQPRYDAIRDPERWRKLDLSRLIKEKKLGTLVSSLILSSFQKKIGDKTGVKPGEEMIRASDLAESRGKKLILADREVRATLLRSWHRIGFFGKMWLSSTLFASLLVREDVDPEEIERLKQEDVLNDLFAALPGRYSDLRKVVIEERDHYLAEKIFRAAEEYNRKSEGNGKNRILAVLGAGHLAGVEKTLQENRRTELSLLEELPPKKRFRNILSWVGLSLAVIAVGIYAGEKRTEDIQELMIFWAICRSAGAGLGALLSRAHPLTLLVTVLVAPFSIFIFGSRLWMFSALTELLFNKPRVEDFENIAADTDSVGGLLRSFYRNRVLKLFWIIFLVSMGLTAGNLIFWSEFFRDLFAT